MLRQSFEGIPNSRVAHQQDHHRLHRAYNHAIYVDDYDSVAAAIAAAGSDGISNIIFTPGRLYEISEPVDLQQGMKIHGGGSFGFGGAMLKAMAPMDYMVTVSDYCGSFGMSINGNYLASVGLDCYGRCNVLHDNLIQAIGANGQFDGRAIWAHGILFPDYQRNATQTINGWAIYGLRDDGPAYYGINVGLSTMNLWAGRAGAIRLEGIFTSISDDFEGTPKNATIHTGPTTSNIKVQSGYFECRRHVDLERSAPIALMDSSGRVRFDGCDFYGESIEAERGPLVQMQSAYQVQITNSTITRFSNVLQGYSAGNARLVVRDCVIGFTGEIMPNNWNAGNAAFVDLQEWVILTT